MNEAYYTVYEVYYQREEENEKVRHCILGNHYTAFLWDTNT